MKKLITALLALFAITPFFTAKADWVKNVTLANYDFTFATTFTTASSNLSGNNTAAPTTVPLSGATGGYMYSGVTSGSGGRGTKITSMTTTEARQDTVYYEFDWNPYRLGGQENSTGTSGIYPNQYSICLIRDSKDSIVFGLWFERWSLKAGTTFNSATGTTPLGDLHLMNLSTDPNNPIPPKVISQTNPTTLVTWSYYTNLLLPFAMLDQNFSTNYFASRCDSINQSTDLGSTFKMNQWYHIKAAIDFKNKKISSFDINLVGSTQVSKHIDNIPFVHTGAQDLSRLEIACTRGNNEGATSGAACNYEQRFDNIDIYTMKQVAASANVTIKYQDGTGTDLQTARVVPNIPVNTVYKATASDKINLIYGGDFYLYDPTSVDSVLVASTGAEIILKFNRANPIATKVSATGPATSELYKDVTLNFAVKTTADNIVSEGHFNVLVNGHVKNSITPDALGTGSVTFPNLLAGTAQIKIVYVGDRIAYSSSDTANVSIEVAPSTSTVIPYPVYFDLGTIPEIMAFRLKHPERLASRPAYIPFANDSLKTITLSTDTTTLTKTMYATWNAYALNATPSKTADYYAGFDRLDFPYGAGAYPNWVTIKTPHLNKGGYNVYLIQRTNLGSGMKTVVTMDDKTLYYPNAELTTPFSIRASGNNGRRFNANTNDGLTQSNYLGSINFDISGTHIFKMVCTSTSESSAEQKNGAWLDMIQFIPIDQDSVSVNIGASAGLSKIYYPLFSAGGYACFSTETFKTLGSEIDLSIPYQVPDQSTYDKKSYTLQHLAVTNPDLGLLGVDYVVIYKNDQWTRVAEGAVNTSDSTFTCDLADGNYYYQEYSYSENSTTPGSIGTRKWMKDGFFTVGTGTDVADTHASSIRTYSFGKTLTVKGIKSGAKITVTDLMGRVILTATSGSDVFTTTLKQGSVYLVKVLSGNDAKTTKVLVQ